MPQIVHLMKEDSGSWLTSINKC